MSNLQLTDQDLNQLKSLGIEVSTVEKQIQDFIDGFPFANLVRPCTPGDGITLLTEDQVEKLNNDYYQLVKDLRIVKFVPASGAASRMFKAIFDFEEKKTVDHEARSTMRQIRKFAFSHHLEHIADSQNDEFAKEIEAATFILHDIGLNYGSLPKGLIEFHQYNGSSRTAFEEHLVEGALYADNGSGTIHIHFTVSPEHLEKIQQHLNEKLAEYEKEYRVKYDISFSTQSESTNTLAVNMDNTPFREEDGSLLFRPGGHGALLRNLNAIEGDIIYIKNIDNVVPDRLKQTTVEYKKALAAKLIELKNSRDELIREYEQDSSNFVEKVNQFLASEISISDVSFNSDAEALEYINRPIRVCGMVKNEGEPGGGPFWVKSSDGKINQQIVETSQVDTDSPEQNKILKSSTHFNPVDLVCAITDHNGEKYDLMSFSDPKTGFISYKSKNGKELKAQELPGLWNGAMANWLTVFVEVPVITFNPVKTLNDLLRPEHQPEN